MRFLRPLSARHLLVVALLSAACTRGDVMPLAPPDAGMDPTTISGAGGLGGSAESTAGRRGPPLDSPFAGNGGSGDAFTPCPGDESSETPLVDALNDAIGRGDFCIRRRLMPRDDLRCDAYNLAATLEFAPATPDDGGTPPPWVSMAIGWHVLPGGSGRAWWATRDATTLEEARSLMLSEDSAEICESAQRVPYKWVAVAHVFDTWVVLLKADMP